jgi:hypothetical protein
MADLLPSRGKIIAGVLNPIPTVVGLSVFWASQAEKSANHAQDVKILSGIRQC